MKRLCELVQVARSSFYAWLGAAPTRAARVAADAELADRIRRVHEADRSQGVSRITAELNDGAPPSVRVNRKRVARGDARPRHREGCGCAAGSAPPSPSLPISGCLIGCVGTSPPLRPTQRYVGDIIYLPLADGSNLYLATVIDCFSRRLTQPMGVVGTSADNALAETFNASLKRETLQGAHAWLHR